MIWHRRGGKSKTLLNEQIRKTQLKRGVYYYFLPTYKQAKAVIWDSLIREHLPLEIVEKVNDSELAIYYKNGSIQRFVGCEDIDKHRGINPIDVVFDEFPDMNVGIWTIIVQPVLRENGGTASWGFTPKGQDHAWKLLQATKDNPLWFWSIQSVYDTKAIAEDELEEARRNTPQAFFAQEYLCEFLVDAGAFFRRIDANTYKNELDHQGHVFQIGVDLAKYQDWTVITPFCLSCFVALPQERFNQIDWNLQKARIEACYLRFNANKVIVDSTGVGDPIAEDLGHRGLNVFPFKFTETSRRQLLDNLAILLEQDKIKIPGDAGLTDELKSFAFALNPESRKITVKVPENQHDDRVMSLALGVYGASVPVPTEEQDFQLYHTEYE